ncbi:MAG: hypothetical protein RJA63_2371 [Pseudomonadota bacterium]|jgi:cbb3-type cytochrome oxidase subunit 3
MRQQINLVNPALLPPKPFFQFRSMMTALAVIALSLSVLAGVFSAKVASYREITDRATQRLALKQERVKELEAQLAQRQKDPQAVAALVKAQTEQMQLRQIAASLARGGMLEDGKSYAAYLEALARKPSRGVWLNRIEFHGARMLLEGMAVSAEDIPPYLSQLQSLPEFAGQRFVSFSLGRRTLNAVGDAKPREALMFRLEPVPGEGAKP